MPLPGAGPQAAHDALAAELLACSNIRTGGLPPLHRLNAYRAWSAEALGRLADVLRPSEADRLIATPRHWTLHALDPAAHGNAAALVDLELAARQTDLAAAVAGLSQVLARRGGHRGALAVADTSVYLHHPEPFDRIDWPALVPGASSSGVHLVIPLLVVDELDRHKRADARKLVVRGGQETVRTRARITIRTLEDMFGDPGWITTVAPGPPHVSAELLFDPPGHARLASADAEIIDRAVAAQDLFGSPVTLVARDTGMVFAARNAGLASVRIPDPDET